MFLLGVEQAETGVEQDKDRLFNFLCSFYSRISNGYSLYDIADLSGVILFGASVSEMFIRDKFGQSAMSKLVIAELAVPHPTIILVRLLISLFDF